MSAARANSLDALSLEQQLKLSLRPVQPSPEFVDHLHNRLTMPAGTTVERRYNAGISLLLLVFSLLSGLLVVWLTRQIRHAVA